MECVLIFHEPMSEFAKRTDPDQREAYWGAWSAYIGAMAEAGVMTHGNGLQAPQTATSVRVRGGDRDVQDGPYADSKEQLGGYVAVQVTSLEDALEWAARSPAAASGTVEVRQVLPANKAELEAA